MTTTRKNSSEPLVKLTLIRKLRYFDAYETFFLSFVLINLFKVIRSGDVQVISTYDLLVGDLVCMESGDMIPADCVYITGDGVKVDGMLVLLC